MAPLSTPELTIFFPTYNEALNLDHTYQVATRACQDLVKRGMIQSYELLFINDGSGDDSGNKLDGLAARDTSVRVIHHEVNRGLGAALKTGFKNSLGEFVLYSDCDLPFDFNEIERALRLSRVYDADIVSAYRFDRTGEGLKRKIYSILYNFLIQRLFHLAMRDVNFALKLCRKRILGLIELESEGSFIDVELLVKTKKLGGKIVQFGVDYFPRIRGESTLASPRVIFGIFRELIILLPKLRRIHPTNLLQLSSEIPSPTK